MNKYIALPRIHPRFLLAALAALILAAPAWSASLTPQEEAKTSTAVIENAKAGKPQKLIVQFENEIINEQIQQKRLAAGLMFDSEELSEEKWRAYAAVREEIFPNGRLGDTRVTYKYTSIPLVVVHVPNIQALEQLLSHPKVILVNENSVMVPYGTGSPFRGVTAY